MHQFLCDLERGMCSCGRLAEEWALKHEALRAELDPARGMRFSPDLNDYVAMCARCHRTYDGNTEALRRTWEDHDARASRNLRGTACTQAILTERDIVEIRRRRASGERLRAIGNDYSISPQHVWHIAARRLWKHVP